VAKSLIEFLAVMIAASRLGAGVLWRVVPLLIFQKTLAAARPTRSGRPRGRRLIKVGLGIGWGSWVLALF
jgi:hypothetical protein